MKAPLLTLLLIPFFLQAQTYSYKPFPDSVAVWVEEYEYGYFDQPTGIGERIIECDIYVMDGDTLLADSTFWKKIWVYGSSNDTVPEFFFGGLKEDSLRRIWLWLSYDTVPFVTYDFGLTVADTFTLSIPNRVSLQAVVTDDDTSFSGGYRSLVLTFDTTVSAAYLPPSPIPNLFIRNIQWKEGEGSFVGLIYFFDFTSNRTGWEYKRLVYHNRDYIDLGAFQCDYVSVAKEQTSLPVLFLAPNPSLNALHIRTENILPNAELFVYTIEGKQVYNTANVSSSNAINTGTWPSGVYLVELRSNGQRKILKWLKGN